MHDCLTYVGTDLLEIEITGDENVDDTKEETGSLPTSARCSESLKESEEDRLFKRFHKCMDHLMSSNLPCQLKCQPTKIIALELF